MATAIQYRGSVALAEPVEHENRNSSHVLRLQDLFNDFDDGSKGWLCMQDVQALTIALCGFWPSPQEVLDFFQNTGPANVQTWHDEWTQQDGEYFRVKSVCMLRPWIQEAIKVAEQTNEQLKVPVQKLPAAIVAQDSVEESGEQTQDTLSGGNEQRHPSDFKCATLSWEEVYDALDTNGDGKLDLEDLQKSLIAVQNSNRLAPLRGIDAETLVSCLLEINANSEALPRDSTQSSLVVTRRQFLHFMKSDRST